MRVECHPHRGRVVKHIPESVSIRPIGGHVFYSTAALLTCVSFDVQPAGPPRVNQKGRRDVHAFARGLLVDTTDALSASRIFFEHTDGAYSVACYNPFVRDYFFDRDSGDIVFDSDLVLITGGICYYAI
jgi:hypothetical protein